MRVVLYGATGNIGSRILRELLHRGHQVIGIARDVSKLQPEQGLTVLHDDLSSVTKSAGIMQGAGAVISAYSPPPNDTGQLVAATGRLIEAVKKSGVPRLLVVGGAGGLEVAPGVSLIDSGHLPAEWLAIARSHNKALDLLRSSDIDWTDLAPAAFIVPGERTGHFRLGTDQLVTDEQGNSRISMEDYAIAMVDELEKPSHIRKRFTIGY